MCSSMCEGCVSAASSGAGRASELGRCYHLKYSMAILSDLRSQES